jgi:hypothetical protein
MKTRFLGLVGAAALAAGLALTSATATAGADAWQHQGNTPAAWQGDHGRSAPTADLSLVHGVHALNVDIYVVKNLFSYKEFKNVQFGTATDVSTDYPGWVTSAFYVVDVVPTGGNPFKPLLITDLFLGANQSKTVAAYVAANAAGTPGILTLGVFTNDLSATSGQARVTVRHLAVAPTVGVHADSTVAITPAFSNGQTATAAVPAGSYHVTVTAPNAPGTVLADLGSVTLPADTNALAFAIGIYPSSFEVVTLAVPTAH